MGLYKIEYPGTLVMTLVESLFTGSLEPRRDSISYPQTVTLGDGSKRILGSPSTTWTWDFMLLAHYKAWKTLYPLASQPTHIYTKNNYGEFQYYAAIMSWPDREPTLDMLVIKNLVITFSRLTNWTP